MRHAGCQCDLTCATRHMTLGVCCHHSITTESSLDEFTGSGSLDTVDDSCATSRRTSRGTDEERGKPHQDPIGCNIIPNWTELDAIDEVMVIRTDDTSRPGPRTTVDMTVDSGATDVVAPPTFAADYKTRSSPGQRNGTKYRTTRGNMVANRGVKQVKMMTEGGPPES